MTTVARQVNLIVADIDASMAFYRLLGITFDDRSGAEWPPGSGARHAEAATDGGLTLELDNLAMAGIWHPGLSEPRGSGASVLGFRVDSRAEVDQIHDRVVARGHRSAVAPYDAFWGSRYAIVADPDGNEVGIMSPRDEASGYTPTF